MCTLYPHSAGPKRKFLKQVPEEAVPSLIRLVHGNRHSKVILAKEFKLYWEQSKSTGEGLVLNIPILWLLHLMEITRNWDLHPQKKHFIHRLGIVFITETW